MKKALLSLSIFFISNIAFGSCRDALDEFFRSVESQQTRSSRSLNVDDPRFDPQGPTTNLRALVFERIARLHNEGIDVPSSKVFTFVLAERNGVQSLDNPRWYTKAWRGSVKVINFIQESFFRVLGYSVTLESHYRSSFNQLLKNAMGNMATIEKFVAKQRERFLRSFENSLTNELKHSEVYEEIYYTIKSARDSGFMKSPVFNLFMRYNEVIRERSRLHYENSELLRQGRANADLAGSTGGLSQLQKDVMLRELDTEAKQLIAEMHRLNSSRELRRRSQSQDPVAKFEVELLTKWNLLDRYRSESDVLLAKMDLEAQKVDILEGELKGRLNGLDVPVSGTTLERLETLLLRNHGRLSGLSEMPDALPVFARLYDSSQSTPTLSFGAYTVPSQRYAEIEGLAKEWRAVWNQRLGDIRTIIEFGVALNSLAEAGYSIWQKFGYAGGKRRLFQTFQWLGNSVTSSPDMTISDQATALIKLDAVAGRSPDGMSSFLNLGSKLSEKSKVDQAAKTIPFDGLTAAKKAEIERVIQAFGEISEYVRAEEAQELSGAKVHSSLAAKRKIKDAFGIVRNYLDKKLAAKEPYEDVIEDLMASPRAMEVRNWISEKNEIIGESEHFDLIVAESILKVQVKRATMHFDPASELMSQVFAWASTSGAGYYAVYHWIHGLN